MGENQRVVAMVDQSRCETKLQTFLYEVHCVTRSAETLFSGLLSRNKCKT